MFNITSLAADNLCYSIHVDGDSATETVKGKCDTLIEAVTAIRIDFACYLVAQTCMLKSNCTSEKLLAACGSFLEWVKPRIGAGVPGANFSTILREWLRFYAFAEKHGYKN